MTKPNIEILNVVHKPAFVPDNDLIKPIQVGAALAGRRLDDMAYYDDQGDSISDRNRSYCELTAVYWAWKNLDADYYGLFHYRRYLSFAPDDPADSYPGRAYPSIPGALEKIGLDEEAMRSVIEANDLIVPRQDDTQLASGDASIYEQYKTEHYIADLDYCMEHIERNHPKIAPHLSALHGTKVYFCNMFIMRKELFEEYCEYIFDVLGAFEANNDISGYNPQQYRVTGFLAERLTNVFIHYAIATGKYRVKELQIAYFENTEPVRELEPLKPEAISVVLAADNYYVPYVSTLLGSVAETASSDHFYDIAVFHRDITPQNQCLLIGELAAHDNISLRFCDMSGRISELHWLETKWHISIETYFRLFIQEVMPEYDKVLYLDGDMIVKRDIAEVFNEDVEGYLLAACQDVDMAGVYNSTAVEAENTVHPEMRQYIDETVQLSDPYRYFQAGVILFNLTEMRKAFSVADLLEVAASENWHYMDQDILNHVAQGRVKYLDLKWNVLYDREYSRIKDVISKAPVAIYDAYMASRTNPYIIHYGGNIKPWMRADSDFATEYWRIARRSSFYELILSRMSVWASSQTRPVVGPALGRIRTRIARKLRRAVEVVAPTGSLQRKPVTAVAKGSRFLLYKVRP
ncbi:DUF4422 domain-containing protein [Leucobacter chironomi]|uniref:DUF4422 domain-containing protein n=1 Tax=Leucobacter chironomi TaxID=491918 RepID=UPI0003FE1BB9|nr:DUF4422 domain-containing protein [Leucobacter chironomi]